MKKNNKDKKPIIDSTDFLNCILSVLFENHLFIRILPFLITGFVFLVISWGLNSYFPLVIFCIFSIANGTYVFIELFRKEREHILEEKKREEEEERKRKEIENSQNLEEGIKRFLGGLGFQRDIEEKRKSEEQIEEQRRIEEEHKRKEQEEDKKRREEEERKRREAERMKKEQEEKERQRMTLHLDPLEINRLETLKKLHFENLERERKEEEERKRREEEERRRREEEERRRREEEERRRREEERKRKEVRNIRQEMDKAETYENYVSLFNKYIYFDKTFYKNPLSEENWKILCNEKTYFSKYSHRKLKDQYKNDYLDNMEIPYFWYEMYLYENEQSGFAIKTIKELEEEQRVKEQEEEFKRKMNDMEEEYRRKINSMEEQLRNKEHELRRREDEVNKRENELKKQNEQLAQNQMELYKEMKEIEKNQNLPSCVTCMGTGFVSRGVSCPDCRGTGKMGDNWGMDFRKY